MCRIVPTRTTRKLYCIRMQLLGMKLELHLRNEPYTWRNIFYFFNQFVSCFVNRVVRSRR